MDRKIHVSVIVPAHNEEKYVKRCIDSIKEGVSGFYINLNAEGICAGMERMLDNVSMKTEGKLGRKFVLGNFDHKVMWPLVLETYSKILNKE